jgi:membrane protein DedA with SNARE-associated domain
MADRGGLILVVARYVPGGRTAVTVTMGAVGYRLRWFSLFAAVAAVSWGLYGALLGYVGGVAFEDDPVKGVAVGLGLALSVTAVVEGVRFVRRRRAAVAEPESEPESGPEFEPGTGTESRRDGDRAARVGPLSGG